MAVAGTRPPRIVLGWRIVRVGFLVGLGCVLMAIVVGQFS